ncbi:MAG TPA: exosortase H [Acidobacteriota bacterium]|nr:exosortase H [Acidobacteriota bacterium]
MAKRKRRPKPRPSPGRLRHIIKANWPLFRIYLWFGLTLVVIFSILMIPAVYFKVIMPLNEFLAWSSAAFLRLMGDNGVVSGGTSVHSPEFGVNIAEGCNGIYALAIVLAGIIAFPARWRPKLIGLTLAVILIMFLNYVRILTLWYAGTSSAFLFDTMHLYVWEFVIIALGAAFWYLWYEKFVKTG